MSDKDMTLAQNMESMKESIEKAGGLFYQYRPCRRNAETIYDIENIRHGVVYAQTPLNMNDPFDSMIGFSAEKVYAECISMLADALECDELTKEVIVTLLQHRAFGKMAELILALKEIKTYVDQRRTIMHQTRMPLETFVNGNAKVLYNKAPKKLKNLFIENTFYALMIIIAKLGDIDISEENIFSMLKMDEMLDTLHKTAIELRDTTYTEQLRNFLSKITVSCFSTSGWDNQLMWSHYANSYSGICVEYDLSKISDFVGFVYPVKYSKDRPTLSLQDVGIGRISIEGTNNIENCDVDIMNIISYIFDSEALGHILHSRLQLAVTAAELFLQKRRVLRIGSLYLHGMKKHLFVFEHFITSVCLLLTILANSEMDIQMHRQICTCINHCTAVNKEKTFRRIYTFHLWRKTDKC